MRKATNIINTLPYLAHHHDELCELINVLVQ